MGEWKTVPLGELGSLRGGCGFPTRLQGGKAGIPFYKVSDMNTEGNETFMFDSNNYVTADLATKLGASVIPTGGIIFAKVGAAIFLERKRILSEPSCIDNNLMALIPDISKVDTRFMHFVLSATRLSDYAESTALPALNAGTISAITILLPPIDEQRAIVASLADSIEEVFRLSSLIAKRRDVQIAVAQQLLKGTTRLPGFRDQWNTINLGDCATFSKGQGLSKKHVVEGGMHKCLLYGELFTTYGRVIESVVSRTNSNEGARSRYGDVLLPGSTTTTGADLATASALLLDDVQLSGDVNIIRPDLTRIDSTYLAYHLTFEQRDAIAMRTQGITIHHLYGKHLADLDVKLPSLAEQTAIAEVLIDLQLSIEALETKKNKAEMVHQGMMSNLLSGKVRIA